MNEVTDILALSQYLGEPQAEGSPRAAGTPQARRVKPSSKKYDPKINLIIM